MAGDYVHVFGVPLETLVWRRTMTHVFFWANHLGIYPAASVSLGAHRRLDTVVASSTSTTSNITCNILISVITLIQVFQGDLSHLACVCMVQSGHKVIQALSKSYLSILSYLNICSADSMRQPCLWAGKTYLHVWACSWSYHTLEYWLQRILCASLIVEEKREKPPHFSCHFTSPTHYYEMMSLNQFCFLKLNLLDNYSFIFLWKPR